VEEVSTGRCCRCCCCCCWVADTPHVLGSRSWAWVRAEAFPPTALAQVLVSIAVAVGAVVWRDVEIFSLASSRVRAVDVVDAVELSLFSLSSACLLVVGCLGTLTWRMPLLLYVQSPLFGQSSQAQRFATWYFAQPFALCWVPLRGITHCVSSHRLLVACIVGSIIWVAAMWRYKVLCLQSSLSLTLQDGTRRSVWRVGACAVLNSCQFLHNTRAANACPFELPRTARLLVEGGQALAATMLLFVSAVVSVVVCPVSIAGFSLLIVANGLVARQYVRAKRAGMTWL